MCAIKQFRGNFIIRAKNPNELLVITKKGSEDNNSQPLFSNPLPCESRGLHLLIDSVIKSCTFNHISMVAESRID